MDETNVNLRNLRTVVAAGMHSYETHGALTPEYVMGIINPLLEKVVSEIANEIENRHALDTSEFVIHYTSVSALITMLQDQVDQEIRKQTFDNFENTDEKLKELQIGKGGSLRLYDSAHSNDPAEGSYIFQELIQSGKHNWLKQSAVTHAYIASFIIPEYDPDRASDNLVFWRTYGREGEGCSLKLKVSTPKLRKVIYGGNELEDTKDDLNLVLDILKPLGSIGNERIDQLLSEAVLVALGRVPYLYKSQAYQYERECRFVILPDEITETDISFDYRTDGNASGRLRHYCEDESLRLGLILSSGSSITIGPCVEYRDDLLQSITILRRKARLFGPVIKPSEIVYRKS